MHFLYVRSMTVRARLRVGLYIGLTTSLAYAHAIMFKTKQEKSTYKKQAQKGSTTPYTSKYDIHHTALQQHSTNHNESCAQSSSLKSLTHTLNQEDRPHIPRKVGEGVNERAEVRVGQPDVSEKLVVPRRHSVRPVADGKPHDDQNDRRPSESCVAARAKDLPHAPTNLSVMSVSISIAIARTFSFGVDRRRAFWPVTIVP